MKRLIPTLILSFIASTLMFAQDKIVTITNDTINCKITRIGSGFIYFETSTAGIKTRGQINNERVKNYFKAMEAMPDTRAAVSYSKPFSRIRISINGGASFLTGSTKEAEKTMISQGLTASKVKSYYKDMKNGLAANGELTYLFNENTGAGLKYKFFTNISEFDDFTDPGDGMNLLYGRYSENIFVNYYGTSFFFIQGLPAADKFKISASASLGLTTYRNEAELLAEFLLLQSKTIGFDSSLGLEYMISPHISFGADLTAFYSVLGKVKISDGFSSETIKLEKQNRENLSKIDISFGIRFYL